MGGLWRARDFCGRPRRHHSIEWGVYGVPETFVVGREGTIVYKLVGPVTPANFDTVLKAEIDKALAKLP